MGDIMTTADIASMKVHGISALLISYFRYCDIDYLVVLNLLQKFSANNTATIVSFVEGLNFKEIMEKFEYSNINSKQLIDAKENLVGLMPMLK
jgi:hypothetical protein